MRIKQMRPGALLPQRQSDLAAGYDLCAVLDQPEVLQPGETKLIPTGWAFAIDPGYAGFVFARSGLATRQGLAPANKVGIIDADYRGEVFVCMHNHSRLPRTIENGERIAQMVFLPVYCPALEQVEELDDTQRGSGGFGSTGMK